MPMIIVFLSNLIYTNIRDTASLAEHAEDAE